MANRTSQALRGYLWLSGLIPLVAPALLHRRVKLGKELPGRVAEKTGVAGQSRPAGRLVWLHAVGLGEVLALRGLIAAMAAQDPGLEFLVTSTARSSAQVFSANLPERTRHQILPLDAPQYLAQFLDHWRPSLSVWAEQDLWPGAVVAAARRGIPLAMVNARMGHEGYARRARMRGLFGDLFERFTLVCAQDAATAERLTALGARGVRVTGSLKSSAPVLAFDPKTLEEVQTKVAGRRVWVAASTHAGDEREAIAAQAALYADDPAWLLILVPRAIVRAEAVAQALRRAGLGHARRSHGGWAEAADSVWLADSFGELGLWYRLTDQALVGGGFDVVGGHNPWEAAALGTAVYHGQDVRNFAADYQMLDTAGAAKVVHTGELAKALRDKPTEMVAAGRRLVIMTRSALDPLAVELLGLMSRP